MLKHKKLWILLFSFLIIISLCGYLIIKTNTPSSDQTKNIVNTLPNSHVLTKQQAIEDIDIMIDKFNKKHPISVKSTPDSIKAQYDKEIKDLSNNPTVLEVWGACNRILALLDDGHTIVTNKVSEPEAINAEFEMINNQLVFKNGEFKGCVVKKINYIDVNTLYNTFVNQFSFELESYAQYIFAKTIRLKHYLEYSGVNVDEEIIIIFEKNDEIIKKEFSFEKTSQANINTLKDKVYYYNIDKDKSFGLFTLNQCNFNDEYKKCVDDFFKEVKEKNIQNIAIDLRNNSGGNTQVINFFMQYIDVKEYKIFGNVYVRHGSALIKSESQKINNTFNNGLRFKGNIYALTSTMTFSAAMDFATTIKDNNIGKLIGDVPGNMPSCYGDILEYQLPNSKLIFRVSYKYFERIDETKKDEPLIPDYQINADEALNTLYKIIKA